MLTVSVFILSAALLTAMVLNLALKPAFSARLTAICMLVSVAGGLFFYGCGFAETTGDLLLSVIRTPIAVIRMFVGVNELSAISGARVVSTRLGLILFWLVHLTAFYSVASAAMLSLGAEALRHLRLLLSRRGDLTLVYGINDNSVALAKECRAEREGSVVFVAEETSGATVTELNNLGMSVVTGRAAVESRLPLLRTLRSGRRKLTVYALDEATDKNLYYALTLRDALEKLGVPVENTRVTLPGAEDIVASMLQATEQSYGYGFVNVFDPAVLCARALIRLCPPWEQLRFGSDGRAQEDFSCAIVGFGLHGQAVLRQLVMNGQFAGSRFHAAVFSPSFGSESGTLLADCPELFRRYEIESYAEDGRSAFFYQYVSERLSTLKLIAVCTGSDEMNSEVSDNLMRYLKRHGAENICVVQCSRNGARYQQAVGSLILSREIYSRAFLSAETADRPAILLNAAYDGSARSDWDKWLACDSFSKMSSRASADFAPAFLHIAGVKREDVFAGKWAPEGELLQNLAETEHLRWNAFHFAMGYAPMSREQFEAKARSLREKLEAGENCEARIAKDAQQRLHACLIPWDELDALSALETELTGRIVDYKQADINNVLALPKLLAVRESEDRV